MKFVVILILSLISSSLVWAGPSKKALPFSVGEKITYEINYGFITAGSAVLEVLPVANDSSTLRLWALAWNNGFFEAVYPVKDTISTYIRKKDLYPSSFRKVNHEGTWHNHSIIKQNFSTMRAEIADTVFDKKSDGSYAIKRYTDTTVVLETLSHTITSAFYLFRTLDLKPGKEYRFNALSGKKKYKLKVKALYYDTITIEAGTFNCIVVEPILDDDGIFEAKGKMTIWLTNDEYKIPVLVKSKIMVGSISVEMTKYQRSFP